jgi:hypothetical protein
MKNKEDRYRQANKAFFSPGFQDGCFRDENIKKQEVKL